MIDYEVAEPGLIKIKIPKSEIPEPARPKFEFFEGDELTSKPTPIKFLIDGLIEENITGLVYGPSENGKSLVLLDWAFCMANGLEWEGRETKQTEVLIIAGEGHAGYRRRLKALELKYDMKASSRLLISKSAVRIDDPASCDDVNQALQTAGKKPELIIIDTFHRNMEGDENSSKDVGKVLNNIDQFFRSQGAAVLVVHHTGHGQDRARGSSSIRGGVDAEYSVFKDDATNTVTLTCTKGKDLEKPKPLSFVIKPVQLDWTISETDHRPQTSVYLEYTGEAEKTDKKGKLTAREKQILQSLTDALNDKGIEPTAEIQQKFSITGTGAFKNIVSLEDWRPYAYKAIPTDDSKDPASKRRNALNRFKDKFLGSYLMEYAGYIWRIEPSANNGQSALDTTMLDYIPEIDGAKNDSYAFDANNDGALSDSVTSVTKRNKSKSVTDSERNERNTPLKGVTVVTPTPAPENNADDVEVF
jgi:hypothetical protein